jgi:hypothetical protein
MILPSSRKDDVTNLKFEKQITSCKISSLGLSASTPWTLNPVLSIHDQFPKLDVVGSNPISRSIFSITCTPRQISSCLICLNRTWMAQILRL